MPPGVEDLGGIGIRVITDASQIKKGFDAELKGLTQNPVKIPVTIDDRGKISELRKQLAGLDVPITVKINRETARSLKRDIQSQLAGEGGVAIPVKVKNITSGEGQAIRDAIVAAIGPLEIDMTVRWHMEGGPPGQAGVFVRPGGGPGGAGGAAAGGAVARQSGIRPGAVIGGREDARAQQQTAVDVRPESGRGSGRRRSQLRQQEGESEADHRKRLREMQREASQILEERGTDDKQGVKAYNRLISLRQRLGEEGPTARLPFPRQGQDPYPERLDTSGRVVRGGPRVGPLASEAASRRTQTRAGVQAGQAGLAQTFSERDVLQRAFGIQLDDEGNVVDLNRQAGAAGMRAGSIEAFTRQQTTGFRGQRAQRAAFGEGLHLTPQEIDQRRIENATRIAQQLQPRSGGRFIKKADLEKGKLSKPLEELLGPAFAESNAALEAGDISKAIKTAGAARGELLGSAFAGQIPGVGRGTAKRYLDPKRGDESDVGTPEQKMAQADWRIQMDALGAVISDAYRQAGEAQKDLGREPRALGGATTTPLKGRAKLSELGPNAVSYEPRQGEPAEDVGRILANAQARFEGREVDPGIMATIEEAAGAAGAPPVAASSVFGGGGGGEGFFMPFGGGGGAGPVAVTVENFPAWMTSENAQAASPMQSSEAFYRGMEPGERRVLSDAEIAAGAAAQDAKAAARSGKTKTPAKPPRERLSPTGLRSIAQRMVDTGTLGADEAEEILSRGGGGNLSELDQRRQDIEVQLAQSRQGLPIRGFATSVAQELAGGARGATFARFQQAGQKLSEASAIEKDTQRLTTQQKLLEKQQDNINAKKEAGGRLTKAEKAIQASIPADLKEIGEQLKKNALEQKTLVDDADKMSKLTSGERLTNLGKSLTGSLGGFLAYSTALGAVGAGIGGIAFALQDVLERTGGYKASTNALTGALADQTRAASGNARQVVAVAAAQANLSDETYESVRANLEQRASIQAGNKAFDEQIRIMAASRNIGRQGADRALFEPTGGFVIPGLNIETPIGATPSTQELVGRQLQQIPDASGAPGLFDFMLTPDKWEAAEAELADRLTTQADIMEDLNRRFAGSGIEFTESVDQTTDHLHAVNEALRQVGGGDIANQLAVSEAQKRSGLTLTPESLRLLQGAGGQQAFTGALSLEAMRSSRPTPEVMLAAMEDQLRGQQYQIQQNLQNTLQTFLPAQRATQQLAQPMAPFGRSLAPLNAQGGIDMGGVTGIGGQFEGVPDSVVQSFSEYRGRAQEAIDAVISKAREGEEALMRLGVPRSTIEQLRGFGEEITALSQEQANIRLDVQYSQYNRQLFLAKRTLGDLAGLTGRAGATQVGVLQREQLILSRRSQQLGLQTQELGLQTQQLQLQSAEIGQQQNLLQLERSQRQVNFQRAIAGFAAPGTSPEERAARIAEAKIEADYAQREIDFQRQQFGIAQQTLKINKEQFGLQQQAVGLAQQQYQNQVALQDATNNRAYTDQASAIAEMQKAFDAQARIAAIEETKTAISAQRDLVLQEVEAITSAGSEFLKAEVQVTADIMSQTGMFVADVVTKVGTVFDKIAREFASSGLGRLVGAPLPQSSGGQYQPSNQGGTPQPSSYIESGGSNRGHAAGWAGTVNTPTSMTVGEAGTEEIAILRNPRKVFAGGGGGGGGIVMPVYITGNNINARDEGELAVWADRLVRMVESRLGQRAKMLGMGPGR